MRRAARLRPAARRCRGARASTALGFAAALLALAALPATAWGEGGRDLRFGLTGAHGYRIAVEGRGSTAVIQVSRRHVAAATAYIARAKVSATGIRADFAGFGRVAVRFHPSGRAAASASRGGCKGPDHFTSRRGFFRGRVDFDGEGGYTSAHVRRARGTVTSPLALNCSGPPHTLPPRSGGSLRGGRRHARVAYLQAESKSALGGTSLIAADIRGSKALYFATAEKSEGQVAVSRIAFVLASPLTFAFDNSLSAAGLTPPAPFSGTATFQHNPDGSKSWTGSLAVSFPGAEDVPLTGPQFTTRLTGSW
jgi:hypothetical protein